MAAPAAADSAEAPAVACALVAPAVGPGTSGERTAAREEGQEPAEEHSSQDTGRLVAGGRFARVQEEAGLQFGGKELPALKDLLWEKKLEGPKSGECQRAKGDQREWDGTDQAICKLG